MKDTKAAEHELIQFLTAPESSGYQADVYKTACSYGKTRGGIAEVAFGLTGFPDFVRPNYQVKFGDSTIIAFRGDNHAKDTRVEAGYNPFNLSSGFNYDGNVFVINE